MWDSFLGYGIALVVALIGAGLFARRRTRMLRTIRAEQEVAAALSDGSTKDEFLRHIDEHAARYLAEARRPSQAWETFEAVTWFGTGLTLIALVMVQILGWVGVIDAHADVPWWLGGTLLVFPTLWLVAVFRGLVVATRRRARVSAS